MPNKNYLSGRRKEYKEMNKLRADGFDIVIRSAGSHSPIDIIGLRRKDGCIKCIQCKPKSMSKKTKQKLQDELFWLDNFFNVSFEVV